METTTQRGVPSADPIAVIRAHGEQVGLCASCSYLRAAVARRSVFVRCGAAAGDPKLARYPVLPVSSCHRFAPVDAARPLQEE